MPQENLNDVPSTGTAILLLFTVLTSAGNVVSGTNTVEALRAARSIAFTPEYNDRADAPDYVVVVTDGVSSSNPRMGAANLTVVAKLLHEQTNAVSCFTLRLKSKSLLVD